MFLFTSFFFFFFLSGFDEVDVDREACRTEMEVRASLQKVSGSSDSVTTLNSEEFVLVPQRGGDTSTKDDEKPELKVFFPFLQMILF